MPEQPMETVESPSATAVIPCKRHLEQPTFARRHQSVSFATQVFKREEEEDEYNHQSHGCGTPATATCNKNEDDHGWAICSRNDNREEDEYPDEIEEEGSMDTSELFLVQSPPPSSSRRSSLHDAVSDLNWDHCVVEEDDDGDLPAAATTPSSFAMQQLDSTSSSDSTTWEADPLSARTGDEVETDWLLQHDRWRRRRA